jgi:hypothetical protein
LALWNAPPRIWVGLKDNRRAFLATVVDDHVDLVAVPADLPGCGNQLRHGTRLLALCLALELVHVVEYVLPDLPQIVDDLWEVVVLGLQVIQEVARCIGSYLAVEVVQIILGRLLARPGFLQGRRQLLLEVCLGLLGLLLGGW